MYLKMKIDIRRRKKITRLENIQRNFNLTENPYQISNNSHSYDKLVLTNEWLRSQQSTLKMDDVVLGVPDVARYTMAMSPEV